MKKKKKKGTNQGGSGPKQTFSNRPFDGLKLDLEPESAPEPEPEPEPEPQYGDDALYDKEMFDVDPLPAGTRLADRPMEPKPMLIEQDDDSLVMRQLDDMVQGEIPFDFAEANELIEAAVAGLNKRILKRLRRGEFSHQAHIDLHGMRRDQARDAVAKFINESYRNNRRCVLIVHGRGIGSKDNIPVLKNKLAAWLTRGAMGRKVLAYTSAQHYDGGTGAIYVLLRD